MSFVPDLYPKNSRFSFCAIQGGKFQSSVKKLRPNLWASFLALERLLCYPVLELFEGQKGWHRTHLFLWIWSVLAKIVFFIFFLYFFLSFLESLWWKIVTSLNSFHFKFILKASKRWTSLKWVFPQCSLWGSGAVSLLCVDEAEQKGEVNVEPTLWWLAATRQAANPNACDAVAPLKRQQVNANSLVLASETQVTRMRHAGRAMRRNHTEDVTQTVWWWQEWGREGRKRNSSWMDHLSWKSFQHGWDGYTLNTRYFILVLRYSDENGIREVEPQSFPARVASG